jgi:hypothetical protein
LPEGELAWAGRCSEPFLFGGFVRSAKVGVRGGQLFVKATVWVSRPLRPCHRLLEQRNRLVGPP